MDEEKEHPNHTIRNSVYNNFESLSASALKVFWKLFRLRMQATELRDGRRTSVNNHFIVRQVLSKSLTPSDLYSFCQPRSPLQHNLPNSACVHNCHKYTSTSPFSTSLLSPSMSLYSKSESVPTFQHSNILHDEESCLASFWRSARLESMGVNATGSSCIEITKHSTRNISNLMLFCLELSTHWAQSIFGQLCSLL